MYQARMSIELIHSGKRLLLAISLLLITSASFAQVSNAIPELQQAVISDTGRISAAIKKGRQLADLKSQKALAYYDYALRESYKARYNDGIAKVLRNKSYYYMLAKGNFDSSLFYLKQAAEFAKKGLFSITESCLIYQNISYLYFQEGKLTESFNCALMGLSELTTNNVADSLLYLNSYINLSAIYIQLDDAAQAMLFLNKGESIARFLKDNEKLAMIYGNKAGYYLASYYVSYGQEYNARDDTTDIRLKQALYYSHLSYKLGAVSAIQNAGFAYLRMGRPAEAIKFFNKAITAPRRSLKDSITYLTSMGWAYLNMKKYALAEQYELSGYKLAQLAHSNQQIAVVLRVLSEIYIATGRYKEGIQYQKDYYALKMKNADSSRIENIELLRLKNETSEKEKALAQSQLLVARQEANLNKKNLWIGGISGTALLLIIISFSMYRTSKHNQRLESERTLTILQEQEIGNMKAVLKGEEKERVRLARELHDGIMVQLSTVKMSLVSPPKEYEQWTATPYYQQMISQMENATKELRQTAHNLMPDMLLQEGLVGAIHYFCKTLELHSGFKITFRPPADIPRFQPDFEITIYRIVQELVQNIIKHAHATKAMVQLLNFKNSLLTITVEDNGTGFTVNDALEKNEGMGLKSINTRVRALSGLIDIRSSENGTTVYLEFDMAPVLLTGKEEQPKI